MTPSRRPLKLRAKMQVFRQKFQIRGPQECFLSATDAWFRPEQFWKKKQNFINNMEKIATASFWFELLWMQYEKMQVSANKNSNIDAVFKIAS